MAFVLSAQSGAVQIRNSESVGGFILCCNNYKTQQSIIFHHQQGNYKKSKSRLPKQSGLVAGVAGFEPANAAVKVLCLTA